MLQSQHSLRLFYSKLQLIQWTLSLSMDTVVSRKSAYKSYSKKI